MGLSRARRVVSIASAIGLALALAVGPVTAANPTMVYGRPGLGTGCAPGEGCVHDASFHAVDKIAPRTTRVEAGATVDFSVQGFHQVAIFPAGTKPQDVAVDPAAFPFIGNGSGTIHIAPATADTTFKFDAPGKYLIICYIAPHFELANMWGYVTVD
jgi:plastocyanin